MNESEVRDPETGTGKFLSLKVKLDEGSFQKAMKNKIKLNDKGETKHIFVSKILPKT